MIDPCLSRWKTTPYAHQVEDVKSLLANPVFALFSEMGTGKSKTVIDVACVLSEEGLLDLVLIIAPAEVRGVWADANPELGEIKKHSWIPSRVREFHTKTRVIWQDEKPKLDFLVTNYEFCRREERREALKTFLHGKKVLMVLDEASAIKNRQAAQTKACLDLGKLADRRVILTGTPIAGNPLDLWTQARFLSKTILPYKNFFHFRSEFAVMGGWHNHQVLQYKNLDRLQAHMAPYVIRREKKECLDLPAKIYTTLEVPLTEATWQIYKQMKEESVVWLGENPSLAAQAGVRIMRLSQATSGFLGGFVFTDVPLGEERAAEEIGREKLNAIRRWLVDRLAEDSALRVIAWCRFRREIERMAEDLKDLFTTYKFYGDSTREEKDLAKQRFITQRDDKPELLVAQPQSGGFGLTLTAAHTVINVSHDFNLRTRLQAEDRVHRPGQAQPVLYLDVIATGPRGQKTIDHQVVAALRKKDDISKWTVSAWKRALEEE